MEVYLNGRFLSESAALVSVADRGFCHGDGLFETIRVHQYHPFRWESHLARLAAGMSLLKLSLPLSTNELRDVATELTRRNSLPDAMLRLALSRGVGTRGYSTRGADAPTLVMSLHPAPGIDLSAPLRWKLRTADVRLAPDDPLLRCKTANRLAYVLARSAAEAAGADEALLLNTRGEVVSAASGNLFWWCDGKLFTPPLACGALPGVTREWVIEWARASGQPAAEQATDIAGLLRAEGVFVTMSSFGLIEVIALDDSPLARSPGTGIVRAKWWAAVRQAAG